MHARVAHFDALAHVGGVHPLLALFVERGESEVVIGLDSLTGITKVRSRVGRSDKFPPHLHATKSCFFERHPGVLPCQSLETEAPSRLKEDHLSVQM